MCEHQCFERYALNECVCENVCVSLTKVVSREIRPQLPVVPVPFPSPGLVGADLPPCLLYTRNFNYLKGLCQGVMS